MPKCLTKRNKLPLKAAVISHVLNKVQIPVAKPILMDLFFANRVDVTNIQPEGAFGFKTISQVITWLILKSPHTINKSIEML